MSFRLNYLPKLDALRGIAALMVVICHYTSDLKLPFFEYGRYGVEVFFVISGFLITYILLKQKHNSNISRKKLYVNFVIKRALRLFPIYYIFLTLLAIISLIGGLYLCDKGNIWHYFTYTQNYLFYTKGYQSPLLFHTWSLAVEEQFYFFWPLLILFISKRFELPIIMIIILVGFLSRIYFITTYAGTGTILGVTFIRFDTLGTGALLSYIIFYNNLKIITFLNKYVQYIFAIVLLISIVLSASGNFYLFLLPLSLAMMAVCAVYICIDSTATFLNPILNYKRLQYIGKISYGIYLFHKPVPFFFNYIYSKFHLPLIESKIVLFVICFIITLTIAILSWNLIEKPLLKLKSRFDL